MKYIILSLIAGLLGSCNLIPVLTTPAVEVAVEKVAEEIIELETGDNVKLVPKA